MSIFSQIKEAANITLSQYIEKAKKATKEKEYVIQRKAISGLEKVDESEVGYKDRATSVNFDILRQMALKDSIVAAIIQTRVNQVKAFGVPQPDKYSVGFKISLRDEKEVSDEKDDENIKKLEYWILNTGHIENRDEKNQLSFTDFLGLITRDLLTYDQTAIETIQANDSTLSYFLPTSAGSIRFASKALTKNKELIATINKDRSLVSPFDSEQEQNEVRIAEQDVKRQDEDYRYVQIYQGQIVRGFFSDEMILKMMNPTTELDANGYSIGPLELLANIVSYHLFSEAHNRLFFIQGFASRGILHIEGEIPPQQLEGFRKQWREQLSGAQNSWRTPILAGGSKINWIPLQATNRDMEWSSWMEYLIKLMCAIYAIAPQEINFDITREGGSGLGDSGERNKVIFGDSKDRGLRPLLTFIESIINECLIKRYDEAVYQKYKFKFVGLDSESREKEVERQEKEVKVFKTINEIRAEHDLDEIEGGDILLDPTYMQWYAAFSEEGKKQKQQEMKLQEKQLAQKAAQGGEDGNGSKDAKDSKKPQKKKSKPEADLDEPPEADGKNIDEVFSMTKSMGGSKPQLIKIEYYKK